MKIYPVILSGGAGTRLWPLSPAIAQAAGAAVQTAYSDLDFCWLDETAFAASPSDSIDYAVMEHTRDTKVYRPWGYYEGIDAGERLQVKRICVKPGEKLSLQMHHHRAEHWIVVSGTARVTCGDKVTLLAENESTYIPIGMTHRLENPGKLPLHLIEVQSGSYLGEDDIVRFEDIYKRA